MIFGKDNTQDCIISTSGYDFRKGQPFDSETEATADSEQVLLGGIEVIDGGDWDPARLKPH